MLNTTDMVVTKTDIDLLSQSLGSPKEAGFEPPLIPPLLTVASVRREKQNMSRGVGELKEPRE